VVFHPHTLYISALWASTVKKQRNMRLITTVILILFFATHITYGQDNSAKKNYKEELKIAGKSFSSFFYPNYAKLYRLTKKEFVSKIDSARDIFESTLNKYDGQRWWSRFGKSSI
jgi:hypothetical protein